MVEGPSAISVSGTAESAPTKEVATDGAAREMPPGDVSTPAKATDSDDKVPKAPAATKEAETAAGAGAQPVLTAISDLEMIALAAITRGEGAKANGGAPGYSAHALREMAAAHRQEVGADSEILLALAAAAEQEEIVKAGQRSHGKTNGGETSAVSSAATAAQEAMGQVSPGEEATKSPGAVAKGKDATSSEELESFISRNVDLRSAGSESGRVGRTEAAGGSASPIARAALGILGLGREAEREGINRTASSPGRQAKAGGPRRTALCGSSQTPPGRPAAEPPSTTYSLVASSPAEADLASSSRAGTSPAGAALDEDGPKSNSALPGGSDSAEDEHLTKAVWPVSSVSSGFWGRWHMNSSSRHENPTTMQPSLAKRSASGAGAATGHAEKAPLVGQDSAEASESTVARTTPLAVLQSSVASSRAWLADKYAKLPPAETVTSHMQLSKLRELLAVPAGMFRSQLAPSDRAEVDPLKPSESKGTAPRWSRVSDENLDGKGVEGEGPPEKYETWEVVRDFCCDIRVIILLGILFLLLLAMWLSVDKADHTSLQSSTTGAVFFPPPAAPVLSIPPPTPTSTPTPTPGPASGSLTCSGACCSSNAPLIPTMVPTMASEWWSSQMADRAQVQLRGMSSGKWLGPNEKTGRWSELGAFLSSPTEKEFLKVLRVNTTAVMLRTPEEYLMVAHADGAVAASTTLHEPSTIFMVDTVKASAHQIRLIAYDGKYLATKPDGEFYRTANPSLAEVFDVREVMAVPSIRGVSLSNWLLVEEWIEPALFIRIPLFTDGLALQIQSVATANWVSSGGGGGVPITCASASPEPAYGTFFLRTLGNNTYQLRTHDHWYLSAENGGGGALYADVAQPGSLGYENFVFVFNPADPTEFLIKTAKGYYVGVGTDGALEATTLAAGVKTGSGRSTWNGPLAFGYNEISAVRGEWQLSNYLGPSAAAEALGEHRKTWVTEADFAYLAELNINAVRIPIGYWLTQEDKPDAPFVPGGAALLDEAFAWGEKYGISIYVTLNGVPGSQNGRESSGSRDGIADWASDATNIDRTLGAVEWVVERYASSTAFFGIGLLNEPVSIAVNLDVLKQFYIDGYNVVRNHSHCAYVGMQPRVDGDPYELDVFFTRQPFTNVVVDMHFFNVFNPDLQSMSFDETMTFVNTTRAEEIAEIQHSGVKVLVGQWSLELPGNSTATDLQYQDFADVQLETYAGATAGWFFFSYKMGRLQWPQWSFQLGIENNWLAQVEGGGWP
eukprot:TRINITY_DN512_c0_g1_i1.p1 TRINITY_DN512_c0_g1~~TRINITY_DN512_c0_g1_i1.p1  ORF type:complete len:1246 (+),score=218.65 TRINITY_DN512_c0_g1_i1:278-4015(+)